MIRAVYPGTFDPITCGHEDLVRRAAGLFDTVVVGVADSRGKKPFFTLTERIDLARDALAQYKNVRVEGFSGLLRDFVHQQEARVILRGLRALSDFEFELQIAHTNKSLDPDLETLFLATGVNHSFLSSSVVKEVARFGGDVSHMVPEGVAQDLRRLFNRPSPPG